MQRKLVDDEISLNLQCLLNVLVRFCKIFLFLQFALIGMVCLVKVIIIYQFFAAEKMDSNDNSKNINCPSFVIFDPSIYDDIFLNIKSDTLKNEQFYFKHLSFYIIFWTLEIFYAVFEFLRQSKRIFMIKSVNNCIDPRILRLVSFDELCLVVCDSLRKLKGEELKYDSESMKEYILQNIYNNTKLIGWIQIRCMNQEIDFLEVL